MGCVVWSVVSSYKEILWILGQGQSQSSMTGQSTKKSFAKGKKEKNQYFMYSFIFYGL